MHSFESTIEMHNVSFKIRVNFLQVAQHSVSKELGSFVEVEIGGDIVAKTNVRVKPNKEPIWNENFHIRVCHHVEKISLRVSFPCIENCFNWFSLVSEFDMVMRAKLVAARTIRIT